MKNVHWPVVVLVQWPGGHQGLAGKTTGPVKSDPFGILLRDSLEQASPKRAVVSTLGGVAK
jgi:hypothetical protein